MVPADESVTTGGGGGKKEASTLVQRFPATNLQVLAHFYRGELSRANVWRQRMDATSHWAVVSTMAIVSLAYSSTEASILLLPFCCMLLYLLLHIEARRYRYFDVWRMRVRMLEVHLMSHWRKGTGAKSCAMTYLALPIRCLGGKPSVVGFRVPISGCFSSSSVPGYCWHGLGHRSREISPVVCTRRSVTKESHRKLLSGEWPSFTSTWAFC